MAREACGSLIPVKLRLEVPAKPTEAFWTPIPVANAVSVDVATIARVGCAVLAPAVPRVEVELSAIPAGCSRTAPSTRDEAADIDNEP